MELGPVIRRYLRAFKLGLLAGIGWALVYYFGHDYRWYFGMGTVFGILVYGLTIGYFQGEYPGSKAEIALGTFNFCVAFMIWPLSYPMILWLSAFGKYGLRWR